MDTRNSSPITTFPTPPGPRSNPLSGWIAWAFRRDPLRYLTSLAQNYGDLSCFRIGKRELYLLNHPDFIRAVLNSDQDYFIQAQPFPHPIISPFEELSVSFWLTRNCTAISQNISSLSRDCASASIHVTDFLEGVVEHTACFSTDWRNDQTLDIFAEIVTLSKAVFNEAGCEIIASVLAWTCYLLAENHASERRIQAELDTVLAHRLPALRDLQSLTFTHQVLAESMRLYPPIWMICRQAIEDYSFDLGEGGFTRYFLPRESSVLISPWVMHHDARYYPDPFRFEPTRWILEAQVSRPRFAYLPFGGDPCLEDDQGIAWTTILLLLATIAKNWRLRLQSTHPVEMQPTGTLRPKYGMRLVLENRYADRRR